MIEPTMDFQVLIQRLTALKETKDRIKKVEDDLKGFKKYVEGETDTLCKEIMGHKLEKVDVPNVGSFSSKMGTYVYFPNKDDFSNRELLLKSITKHFGKPQLLNALTINYMSLTKMNEELREIGTIGETEFMEGIVSSKQKFKLSIRGNKS